MSLFRPACSAIMIRQRRAATRLQAILREWRTRRPHLALRRARGLRASMHANAKERKPSCAYRCRCVDEDERRKGCVWWGGAHGSPTPHDDAHWLAASR
jgi:hypothetical protein